MCGICGYYNEGGAELLRDMCGLMKHRGPDDRGFYVAKKGGLGMTRLAIIDPASGHQPIFNEDNTIAVVFNGEIYNYRELRERLIAKGHTFRTHADTEVIVHLYEDYGYDCVSQMRGIFALAIWDRDTLYLARDRLGVKPLYYTWVGGNFYFASEIKALLTCPGVERAVDAEALDDYMTFQYTAAPKTLFKNIFKVPAAHWLKINENGAWAYRYWTLPDPDRKPKKGRDAVAEIGAIIEEAVRLRTMADVPLGALLSGGLDSSYVVAALARNIPRPLKTFHIFFAGETTEAEYARAVAGRFGCEHYEYEARPADLRYIPDVIWHLDEPIADAAAWATYLLCRFAKKEVTVLLTGEGGDEMFGGYPRYYLNRAASIFHRLPAPLRRLTAGAVDFAHHRFDDVDWLKHASKIAHSARQPWERNAAWLSVFNNEDRNSVYAEDFRRQISGGRAAELYEDYYRTYPAFSDLQRLTVADIKTWLVDNVLMKVDKTSMATGVEARVPFLDHVLVENVLRLSASERFGGGWPKPLLKKIAVGALPDSVINRPKRAFEVPVDKWLRRFEREWVQETLLTPTFFNRGYFNRAALISLLSHYFDGGVGGKKIWNLFCLELWHRLFIDAPPPRERPTGVEVREVLIVDN